MKGARERRLLRSLARLYGVMPAYHDVEGERREATPEALVAVLRVLGAPLTHPGEAAEALTARRQELWRRVVPACAVGWGGGPSTLTLRLPAGGSGRLEVRLECEEGPVHEWSVEWDALRARRPAWVAGVRFEARRLRLPDGLPPGVHRLTARGSGAEGSGWVLVAPPVAWQDPETGRGWGTFLPLYAARSEGSWGTGRFAELAALARWTGGRGGGLVGTVPLLAAFLDVPFEPGPYAPASRLAWNELYADLERAPELVASAEARAALADPQLRAEVEALRAAPLVAWRRAADLHHRLLAPLARRFFDAGGGRRPEFRRFLAQNPDLRAYARFRACLERRRQPWRSWPEPARSGTILRRDASPETERRHLYAQWLAANQLAEAETAARRAGCGLYLDLPLGSHPDGFDSWHERDAYAEGVAIGAPPDPFAADGQDWGLPPLLPEELAAGGLLHWRRILRVHMRHASLLRVDHVMGLHRQFWVPSGSSAREGVYVRYPAETLYAVLCLESWRARCEVAGEDLGTVPETIRATMVRRGVLRSYVLAFSLPRQAGETPAPVPPGSVASFGTHDLFPFAGFWEGRDVEVARKRDGRPAEEARAEARQVAESRRAAVGAWLGSRGWPAAPSVTEALAGCLAFLGSSPARHVVVSAEDLWGETEAQNVPGTTEPERLNWRRRARLSLGDLAAETQAAELTRILDAARWEADEGRGGGGQREAPG